MQASGVDSEVYAALIGAITGAILGAGLSMLASIFVARREERKLAASRRTMLNREISQNREVANTYWRALKAKQAWSNEEELFSFSPGIANAITIAGTPAFSFEVWSRSIAGIAEAINEQESQLVFRHYTLAREIIDKCETIYGMKESRMTRNGLFANDGPDLARSVVASLEELKQLSPLS